MSVDKFTVETGNAAIQVEVRIDKVRIYMRQFTGEGSSAELVLDPDEVRELSRMINLIATVAEGSK